MRYLGNMATPDFTQMNYGEIKATLFARLPAEQQTEADCYLALAAIDVMHVIRPAESENSGSRVSTRDLAAMRQKFEKRLAVLGWNGRCVETVIPTDDLQ